MYSLALALSPSSMTLKRSGNSEMRPVLHILRILYLKIALHEENVHMMKYSFSMIKFEHDSIVQALPASSQS